MSIMALCKRCKKREPVKGYLDVSKHYNAICGLCNQDLETILSEVGLKYGILANHVLTKEEIKIIVNTAEFIQRWIKL